MALEELEKEKMIAEAKSYEQVYSALDKIGDVRGGGGEVYTPGELKGIIENCKNKGQTLLGITRTYNLRGKVRNIMLSDYEPQKEIGWFYSPEIRGKMLADKQSWQEGFKIHISSDSDSIAAVVDTAMPILRKYKVPHKISRGVEELEKLKGTQKGKFITIYTKADTPTYEICKEIDSALTRIKEHLKKETMGPKIENEESFGKSGGIYIRYGAYQGDEITGPRGEKIEDRRDRPAIPWWKVDDFVKIFKAEPKEVWRPE